MSNELNASVAIPLKVWRDGRLKPSHLKLYGELVLMGGGTLTNGELAARLGGVHRLSVSRWLSELEQWGHVERRLHRDNRGMVIRRDIVLTAGIIHDQRPEVEGGINSEVKGVNSEVKYNINNVDINTLSNPLKGTEAVPVKVGVDPPGEPESYTSGDVNVSDAVHSGAFKTGYGPVFRRMNNWDKMEQKLRDHAELSAPDLLLAFRKLYREKGLGEYTHRQSDVYKMKGFISVTPDLSTGGRLTIMDYYLSRWKYRHKEWEVESDPTVGIMVGFLNQYMGLALKEAGEKTA